MLRGDYDYYKNNQLFCWILKIAVLELLTEKLVLLIQSREADKVKRIYNLGVIGLFLDKYVELTSLSADKEVFLLGTSLKLAEGEYPWKIIKKLKNISCIVINANV